jgi:hypothetical protein
MLNSAINTQYKSNGERFPMISVMEKHSISYQLAQKAHQTAPTQFIEANGIRFAYRRFGKAGGVPLVVDMQLPRRFGRLTASNTARTLLPVVRAGSISSRALHRLSNMSTERLWLKGILSSCTDDFRTSASL